ALTGAAARCLRRRRSAAQTLEPGPVAPCRREALDGEGALGDGRHLVRHVAEDAPGVAWDEVAGLVRDPEPHRPADQDAELLVVVTVFGDGASRLQVDERERRPLALDRLHGDAVPDAHMVVGLETVEGAHAVTLSCPPAR